MLGLEQVVAALEEADGGCNIVGSIAEQTVDYLEYSWERI